MGLIGLEILGVIAYSIVLFTVGALFGKKLWSWGYEKFYRLFLDKLK